MMMMMIVMMTRQPLKNSQSVLTLTLLCSASTFSSDKGGEAGPGNTEVGDFTKKDQISSFPIYRTETGGFEQCKQYVVDWNLVLNGTKPLTQEVGDLKI